MPETFCIARIIDPFTHRRHHDFDGVMNEVCREFLAEVRRKFPDGYIVERIRISPWWSRNGDGTLVELDCRESNHEYLKQLHEVSNSYLTSITAEYWHWMNRALSAERTLSRIKRISLTLLVVLIILICL